MEFFRIITDYDGVGMSQNIINGLDHHLGNMGNKVEDIITVGPHEAGQVDVFIINPDIISLAEKAFNHLNHRAFTKVIGSGLETETQHTHLAARLGKNHVQAALDLQNIAWDDVV